MAFKTEITITNPMTVYTCGDVIKGTVCLRSQENVIVEDLLIQLLCKVVTCSKPKDGFVGVNKHGNHRTVSIPYCYVTRLVTQSRQICGDEPFGFEFTIPFETKRNDIEPSWHPSGLFEQSAGHAIPPMERSMWQSKGDAWSGSRHAHGENEWRTPEENNYGPRDQFQSLQSGRIPGREVCCDQSNGSSKGAPIRVLPERPNPAQEESRTTVDSG